MGKSDDATDATFGGSPSADDSMIAGLLSQAMGGSSAPDEEPGDSDGDALLAAIGDDLSDDPAEEPSAEGAEDPEEDIGAPEAEGISADDLQTLKRAKYSDKAIAKMDPELAAELAEMAREDKRASDREFQEYLAQKRKADNDEPERQEATEQVQPSASNLQDLVSLSQPFAEDLGVEPEQLAAFAKVLIDASSGPLQQQLVSQSALLEEALIDSAVSRLGGEFPQLRGSDKFADVLQKTVRRLSDNPEASGSVIDRITAAMREVASLEFKDEILKRELAERDKKRNARRQQTSGHPSSTTRKAGGQPMSQDDWLTQRSQELLGKAGL